MLFSLNIYETIKHNITNHKYKTIINRIIIEFLRIVYH